MNIDSDIYTIRINHKEGNNMQHTIPMFYKNVAIPWANNPEFTLYAVKSGKKVQILLLDNQKVLKRVSFYTSSARKYFSLNGDTLLPHTKTYKNIKSYLQKQ